MDKIASLHFEVVNLMVLSNNSMCYKFIKYFIMRQGYGVKYIVK